MGTGFCKHNSMEAALQRLLLACIVAGGLWLLPSVVHASTGEEIEDGDQYACGTLIGEGEACGWPEFDPNDYDPITGEPLTGDGSTTPPTGSDPVTPTVPPPTSNGVVKCPVVVGEGVVCTGPTIPADPPVPGDTSPGEGPGNGTGEPEPVEGVEVPPCAQPHGDGLVCSGPDPLPVPTEGPSPEEPADDSETGDPVEDSEVELGAGPRVEPPLEGQGTRMLRIFVPTLSR